MLRNRNCSLVLWLLMFFILIFNRSWCLVRIAYQCTNVMHDLVVCLVDIQEHPRYCIELRL